MIDSTIVYVTLFMAFILLVIMKRLFSFGRKRIENKSFMFYRLDFAKQDITLINVVILEEDISKLKCIGYGLILLAELKAVIKGKGELPAHVLFIASNEKYSYLLKRALLA